MTHFKNYLIILLILFSSLLFSQSDSTKWFRKFHVGVVLNNYNYWEPSKYYKDYSKNFGIIGIGGTLGYDKVFIEGGYSTGYDYIKNDSKKTIKKPEGAFFKGIWYPINKSKIRIGFGGYLSFYHFTLNYKDYWGIQRDVKFISGHYNIVTAIDYKIYQKLFLIGEVHFGRYESDNLTSSSHSDDGYSNRNIGLNFGLKYLFL